jgi:uncharacterized membrane protein
MFRELSKLKSLNPKDLALIAIFSALMAITTMWAIPLPFGGITHLGNTVMWTASILFGGVIGGIAGGIGGMLVDLILFPMWAPFTLFCKFFSGFACGIVAGTPKELNRKTATRIVAATIVGAIVNNLAYAPVYYLLLGYGSMLAWIVNFALPTRFITYFLTPIISAAIIKTYPSILDYGRSEDEKASSLEKDVMSK